MNQQREANVAKTNLTENQKLKFNEISKRYDNQLRIIRQEDLPREAREAKVKPLMEAKNKELKTLLHKTQYAAYIQTQKKRKKQMKKERASVIL